MTKAIFIILTLAGFASGAEWEAADKLTVDGSTMLKSTVTIVSQSSQSYILGLQKPSGEVAVQVATTGNMAVGTTTVSGARLAIIGSTDTAYALAVGTSTNYSLTVSTGGRLQANEIYRGTYTVLDSSMLDSFTLKLDTTTNKIKLVDRLEQNIMLDAFKIAVSSSLSKFNMVDGIMDEFEDESGVDTVASSSQTYNSAGHYYSPLVTIGGIDSNTKLMLHFNSLINGSKEIQDSGYTGYVVTCVNGANISTAQAKIGLSSLSLNGSNQYLTVPDSNDWNFGSGNFTIDFWANFNSAAGNQGFCFMGDPAGTDYFLFSMFSGVIYFVSNAGGTRIAYYTYNWASSTATWHHIALVRNGTSLLLFIDGDLKNWTTNTQAIGSSSMPGNNTAFYIGKDAANAAYLNGYIDEFRISKALARWTTAFTPQTAPYTSDSDTKLLLHMESLDVSGTAPKIPTFVGTAHLDTAQKEFGSASLFLNGSSDYVTVPDSEDWNFGTDPFTIDFWVRYNSFPARSSDLIGHSSYTGALTYDNDVTQRCYQVNFGSSGFQFQTPNSQPNLNQWYHIALVRVDNGNTAASWRIFIDGVSQTLTKNRGNWSDTFPNPSSAMQIGYQGLGYLNGWIDELRISKGIARWTTDFTPPAMEYAITTSTYDMVLVSTITTAMAVPSNARLVLFEEDGDTVALNSDVKVYVTGKDTASWTQVTLADEGNYQSGRRILSGMASIAAASAGTAMRWKVETHNNRNLKLHGVGLNWD